VLRTVHFALFMFYSISYYNGFMKCLYVNMAFYLHFPIPSIEHRCTSFWNWQCCY